MKILATSWVKAFLLPRPLIGILYLPRYFIHLYRYGNSSPNQKIAFLDLQPCLADWIAHTPFDSHYFYQGAWLARRVHSMSVSKHVDIGSSVLTMSVLSAQVEVTFVDYRPLKSSLPGLISIAGDILNLSFEDNSIESLSCLHVIEHIGLGRYGDPIDALGSVKAARELERVVNCGGSLFLSLPIGRERVCFNAHRVHAPASVINLFPKMELVEFSCVDDDGQYTENASLKEASKFEYGCGLFHFRKI